ncbi:MAG TPA: phage portal protein [Vicinamibacterales bacterium]|nr:phage portal protein [Vicinamibacterales bacterium]
MAIVSSFGSLQRVVTNQPMWHTASGSVALYGSSQTYAAIYRTQPNVRTCVDFLARNVAQLGLHVYRAVSDTDRVRLREHDLAQWFRAPNPATTRYRLVESLIQDLAVYLNAYWAKVREDDRINLVRLPPDQMRVEGALLPSAFLWTAPDGVERRYAPADVVHFGGYDPGNPLMGLSPLETLRRVLAEEAAASDQRQHFWANAARIGGVITVDANGPQYSPDQLSAFRQQWQDAYAGAANTEKTAVLPKGMNFEAATFSAKDSEFIESRKLNREEVAAAYHIPLPMVGILDHATYSNIKEQHKHLYQDCLGPWLVMIEEEIERQLLPDCDDTDGVYVEFNIAEKLKGSFEEQASSLQVSVGRPVMTVNEGRARLNLPRDTDPNSDKIAEVSPGQGRTFGGVIDADGVEDDASDAGATGAVAPDATPDGTTAKENQAIFGYHLQYGVAKLGDARRNLNLPSDPKTDDMTVPEYFNSLGIGIKSRGTPSSGGDDDA